MMVARHDQPTGESEFLNKRIIKSIQVQGQRAPRGYAMKVLE